MCDQGSLVGLHVQDYKSLCVAVMISASLVNIQTDTQMSTHTDSILTSLYEKLSQLDIRYVNLYVTMMVIILIIIIPGQLGDRHLHCE